MAASRQLALGLKVQGGRLEIEILNHSPAPVRIWDRRNSWGWPTLALDVAASARPEDVYALEARPRIWTVNFPASIEIPVGESHLVTFTAGDPEWDGLERIEHLRGEALRVRANLRIPPSPEAEEFEVFIGEVSSPWQESQPPHLWLFSDT